MFDDDVFMFVCGVVTGAATAVLIFAAVTKPDVVVEEHTTPSGAVCQVAKLKDRIAISCTPSVTK